MRGVAWLLLLCGPAVLAESINVDFMDGAGTPSGTYGAAGRVGAWNLVSDDGATVGLVDLTGAATDVTVSFPFGPPFGLVADDPLIEGDASALLEEGFSTGDIVQRVRFTGLDPGYYTLRLYGLFPALPGLGTTFILPGSGISVQAGGAYSGELQEGVTHASVEVEVTGAFLDVDYVGGVGGPGTGSFFSGIQLRKRPRPVFVEMPVDFSVTDISADGQTVAGQFGASNAYWTADGGVVSLGGTGNSRVAISDDARQFAGATQQDGAPSAGYWLGGTDWLALGPLPGATNGCPDLSNVYDMSGDGSTVVGLGWDSCTARAFKWTAETGMIDLGTLVPGRPSRANGISDDGHVIVGWNDLASGQRVAAKWVDEVEEFILQGGNHVGEAYAATPDGSTIVGIGCTNGDGWRWTEAAGVECIDGLSSAWNVSADGAIIVGSEGPPSPNMQAVVNLFGRSFHVETWLGDQSVSAPASWIGLNAPGSVAADGSVFGGWGQKDLAFPFTRDWLVVLELGSPPLFLGKTGETAELSWKHVTGGGRYDAIRGSLTALRASQGDYAVATQTCLINSTPLTDAADADLPDSGEAFWYLVRADVSSHEGTYDSKGPAQHGTRDVEVEASGLGCP